MTFFLIFLAFVAAASAQSECLVTTRGVYRAFDGTNIRGRFSADCIVPLAASDCGSQTWLVTLNRANSVFSLRYQGQTFNPIPSQTIGFPEVTITLSSDGNRLTIRVPSVPSNLECAICSAPGTPPCVNAAQVSSRIRRSLTASSKPSSLEEKNESTKAANSEEGASRGIMEYFIMGKQFVGGFL